SFATRPQNQQSTRKQNHCRNRRGAIDFRRNDIECKSRTSGTHQHQAQTKKFVHDSLPHSIHFLRRARRTSNPPESKTTADAAEAPSISGATAVPANAILAAPTNKRLKLITLNTIFLLWPTSQHTAGCAYFLRWARSTSSPPESRTTADAAEAPSISGATVCCPKAELATPASKRLKPRSFIIARLLRLKVLKGLAVVVLHIST